MPDYSKSKIYTIRCKLDDTLIYVGATVQQLSVRYAEHKRHNRTSICKIVKEKFNNDWSQFYIELYENFSCNSKEELAKREGEIIRLIGTVNQCIAGRTREEWLEDHPEYKDTHKLICKSWRDNNQDKIIEYRELNKENRAEYDKNRPKVDCECGGKYSSSHKARHEKSKIHLDFLKLKQDQ